MNVQEKSETNWQKENKKHHPSIKGNPQIIKAWTIYDWANSAFQLSITSAILPAYFASVSKGNGDGIIDFFGYKLINTSLYAWTVSFSFLIVACLSPILSSIADYTGRRKFFMQCYTFLGSIGCCLLFFMDAKHLEIGMIAFAIASIGYSGSLVFYNAWLPEIAPEGMEDQISAKGFSLGYAGSMILLLINILMLSQPHYFGISEKQIAAKISFVSVGLWWLIFSSYTFKYLPKYLSPKKNISHPLYNGYRELKKVWDEFRKQKKLRTYLSAFFFIIMGVMTIMYMAANFAKKEIGLDDKILIPTIFVIQLIGIIGSLTFANISKKMGNIPAMMIAVCIWIFICAAAWFVVDAKGFILLAVAVGLVMGAVQSLARSTYTKMLPPTNDHTSYFSFYDVVEKIAIVSGTFLFGFMETISGSMRNSIVMLGMIFLIGFYFLTVILLKQRINLKNQ